MATPTSTTQPPTTTPTATSQPQTATPTQAPPTATLTPTRPGPTAVLYRRGFMPLLMRRWTDPLGPTRTLTPRPQATATPSPTPTWEPAGVLPRAGWWSDSEGWLQFRVASDRMHIAHVYFWGQCVQMEQAGLNVPILADGSWTLPFGNANLGGVIAGRFVSPNRCNVQTQDWNATYICGPDDWVALPDD